MDLQLRPLSIDLGRLDGLSQRSIASHHENNCAGAVRRLNAIRKQLGDLDWAAAPVFAINGLKREELIAANSAFLHELYFDALGGDGVLPPSAPRTPPRGARPPRGSRKVAKPHFLDSGLTTARERDFGAAGLPVQPKGDVS